MAQWGSGWRGGVVVVAAFAGGFAAQSLRPVGVAAGGPPGIVTAREIRVVDGDGRVGIRLAFDDDGPAVCLADDRDTDRVRLGRNRDDDGLGWGVRLADGEGAPRLSMVALEDGSGSGLGLIDGAGVTRCGLGSTAEGGGLALRNAADVEVLGLGEGGGADFVLRHPVSGDELWRASRQIPPPAP